MKKHRSILKILLAVLLVSGQWGMLPAEAADERQTAQTAPPVENGWVVVSNREQLAYIDRNQELYLTQNIRLTADIDLSGLDWVPLGGNGRAPFSGTFDGRGYWITGLLLHNDTRKHNGFLGESKGRIQSLNLRADVQGGSAAGALAGSQNGGSVDRVHTEGRVYGGYIDPGVSVVGGIVGALHNATLSRSSSAASVTVSESDNLHGGGLVGNMHIGDISDSYFTGRIDNEPIKNRPVAFGAIAGIVGYQMNFNFINKLNGVRNAYSTGAVSMRNPTTSGYKGAIAAYVNRSRMKGLYYDFVAAGTILGASDTYESEVEIYGKTTAEMKRQSTYTGWDFAHTWTIHPAVNGGYPYLRPEVLTTELPRGAEHESYSAMLDAYDGARGTKVWTASGLPEGLTLTPSGELKGTPAKAGTYAVTVSVSDAGSAVAQRTLQLVVDTPAPRLADAAVEPGTQHGSTRAAVPTQPGHTFAYAWEDPAAAASRPPFVGDPLPQGAVAYVIGTDIADAAPGRILRLFEVNDPERTGNYRIQAWQRFVLEARDIRRIVPVSAVRLEPNTLALVPDGPSALLTVVVEPEGAVMPTLRWSSSDESVAVVDPRGEVRPRAAGTAVITAVSADGVHTAEAAVTVSAQSGTVIGAVYGSDRKPLEGAAVSLDGGPDGTTDSEGRFKLERIAVGIQQLLIRAEGYEEARQSAEVAADQETDVGRIALKPIAVPQPEPKPEPLPQPKPEPEPQPQPEPLPRPEPQPDVVPETSPAPTWEPDVPEPIVRPTVLTLDINGQPLQVRTSKEVDSDGRATVRLKPDAAALEQAFADVGPDIRLSVQTDLPVVLLDLPSESLDIKRKRQPDTVITLEVGGTGYELPLASLPVLDHIQVATIGIRQASSDVVDSWTAAAAKRGAALIGAPVHFCLSLDGQPVEKIEGASGKKIIVLPAPLDPAASTVISIGADGRMRFVPSLFVRDASRTRFVATTRSDEDWLAVVSSKHTFADMANHWGRFYVETLADKLIVEGVSDDQFAPERALTRAEFAAWLVRGLGLSENRPASGFVDLEKEHPYGGAVEAAKQAGLMNGDADGFFRPDEALTREQMASALFRAVVFEDGAAGLASQAGTGAAKALADQAELSPWAYEPVSALMEAGLMQGKPDGRFAPKDSATRAEGAAALNRMLARMKVIDAPAK
ncbi:MULTISPECIES: S-layer homology domain-containing protein [Saccharibacillus]|uniref:S-layer homology domain-containing protein n=1 Tax=Saccharibacillus TaxID=456492 RepID=UPI001365C98E